MMIIVMFIVWIVSIVSFFFAMPYADFLLPGPGMVSYLGFINIFIVVGVPFLAIVLRGIRFLFKRRVLNLRWQAGLWSIWSINIISLFAVGSFTGRQFSEGQQESQSIAIETFEDNDTLHLQLLDNLSRDGMLTFGHVYLSNQELHDGNVELSIERSKDGKFELEQRRYSRGINSEEAALLAGEINYNVVQKNGTLTFPRGFVIEKNGKWRAQRVVLTLRVPDGQFLRIDPEVNRILHVIDVHERGISPWNHRGRLWKMASEGLICNECPESKIGDEEYPHQDFRNLYIEGKMKIEINQGEKYKVRLTGKEVYTRKVDFIQTGEDLTISSDLKDPNSPVRLYITLPHLEKLDLDKTDDVKITGFVQPRMWIKSESRYDLKAYIKVDSLYITEKGRTEFDLRGSGKYLKASLMDQSRLDAEHYTVDVATVSTQNSSRASLSVVDTLHKSNQGSDRIRSDGDPKIVIDSQ